jgi:SAM-dependent methyltransferase
VVEQLPLESESVDRVLTVNTVYFWPDLPVAFAELHRVLAPGGTLVLSLDNLANPVVAVRNALPGAVRYGTGLVPYYVGATVGPWRMRRMLEDAGFTVATSGAKMHCPRVLAVPLADRTRRPRAQAALLGTLDRFEALEALPTRWWTGHFVWAVATRTR